MKKKIIIITFSLILVFAVCFLSACGASGEYGGGLYVPKDSQSAIVDTEDEFTDFKENEFVSTKENPTSYFSMDVSTASYAVLRNYINNGMAISKNMVKIEELLNYFDYSYPAPKNGDPLSLSGNIFPCPWNAESMLFSVGIRSKEVEYTRVKNNLVLLIDVSGSMNTDNKLPLLVEACKLLADQLNQDDRISIVTYSGRERVVLEGAKGSETNKIKSALSSLSAYGATAGQQGIQKAYEIAEKHYIAGGNNRIILATDGDFNVGINSESELKTFIKEKTQQAKGVYLSVIGLGMGNLKMTTMDTLARNGNGSVYYIDNYDEAKKIMQNDLVSLLVVVADDAKASVEFNPNKVSQYRLLGYETRALTQDDWDDDDADAGEIGADFTITAAYEIKLNKEDSEQTTSHSTLLDNFVKASIRYKNPYENISSIPKVDTREVKEISILLGEADILTNEQFNQSEDLLFISAVIESALVIMNSNHKASASIANAIARISSLNCIQNDEHKLGFLTLLQTYQTKYTTR